MSEYNALFFFSSPATVKQRVCKARRPAATRRFSMRLFLYICIAATTSIWTIYFSRLNHYYDDHQDELTLLSSLQSTDSRSQSNDLSTEPKGSAGVSSSSSSSSYLSTNNNNKKHSTRWCTSDDDYLTGGGWRYNRSVTTFPYQPLGDYEWEPLCVEQGREYKATGKVPEYLKYYWQPKSCQLAPFDPQTVCRLLHNKTIGMLGDSIMKQFSHSFRGHMLGFNDDAVERLDDDDHLSTRVSLCPHDGESGAELLFVRWDKYLPEAEHRQVVARFVERSDVLVLNFGVHFLPWLEYEKSMVDLVTTLESHLVDQHKKKKIYWRSTISSHKSDCGNATQPEVNRPTHMNEEWGADEILLQDVGIVQPLLFNRSNNPLVSEMTTVLRVDETTLRRRDGHRIVGHNNKTDCLHYCEPGPIDHWSELLYHHLLLWLDHNITWDNNGIQQ
jgi:hypothetical protein